METVKILLLRLGFFLFYGWKQFLPSYPKVGQHAIVDGDNLGFIRKITDQYIEIYGFYRSPLGGLATTGRRFVAETWTKRYDRGALGKIWREPIRCRDRWDFRGKPLYRPSY